MGIVDVRRDKVQEWLLPTPFTAIGEATVIVSGNRTDTTATVLGTALVIPNCTAPTGVSPLLGDAVVDLFGSVFAHPLLLASAAVEFDNTGSTVKNVAVVPAVAVVEVFGAAQATPQIAGTAALLPTVDAPLTVEVLGDAEVEFAYYGDGNYSVFPYRFPVLFTDNPLNIQDAAALVSLTGVGDIAAISGFAEVVLPSFTGATALTVKGSTPIFPWFLPVVFDDLPANVSAAAAVLALSMDNDSAVAVVGESTVTINAVSSSLPSAVFPWTFPVILIGAV